jgi:hypothetical protein
MDVHSPKNGMKLGIDPYPYSQSIPTVKFQRTDIPELGEPDQHMAAVIAVR